MNMKKTNIKQKERRIFIVTVGFLLTVIGFLIIPDLIKKYSNKRYKRTIKSEEIDFDNMGPEIIQK
jgi:hypothetical protein